MKYDDASWHYGGGFPDDLENESGATHIGMFVAWCILNGLAGEIYTDEFPEDLSKLKERELTPGAWFIEHCDEKFTSEDLNQKGNDFAAFYYAAEDAQFADDYGDILGDDYESLYHVPDTWDNFDKFSPLIRSRFEAWSNNRG